MEMSDYGWDKKHTEQNNVDIIEVFLDHLNNLCYFPLFRRAGASGELHHLQARHCIL